MSPQHVVADLRHGLRLFVAMFSTVDALLLRPPPVDAAAPFSPTYDAWAVAALLPLLFVVTLLAAFVPARKAATVNPIVALREE